MMGNPLDHPAVAASLLEMKQTSDMFAKMSAGCFKKCVVSYAEPELNVGELSCVDRCVSKYLACAEKVSAKLQEAQPPGQPQ